MLTSLSHHELLVFWTQLLTLFAVARLLGALAKRLGLPSVVGELSAGLLLGPSIFGVFFPGTFDWFLPSGEYSETQSAMLLAVSWFGAAFLLVVAGFETDLDLIARLGRAAALVTAGSVLVPLAGGLVAGWLMPTDFYGQVDGVQPERLVFALFIAASVAVSALAVIAKILGDLGLMRRDVGQITIAAGMANDLVGWVILGVIAGLAASGTLSAVDAMVTVAGLSLFMVAALTIGQRVIDAALRLVRRDGRNIRGALTVMIAAMLSFGVITQALGVEAVLGAFVAGVVLARSRYQQIEAEHAIEDLTSVVFAPLFFATAGLRLDLSLLRGSAPYLGRDSVAGRPRTQVHRVTARSQTRRPDHPGRFRVGLGAECSWCSGNHHRHGWFVTRRVQSDGVHHHRHDSVGDVAFSLDRTQGVQPRSRGFGGRA